MQKKPHNRAVLFYPEVLFVYPTHNSLVYETIENTRFYKGCVYYLCIFRCCFSNLNNARKPKEDRISPALFSYFLYSVWYSQVFVLPLAPISLSSLLIALLRDSVSPFT